jgi:hypothetical protein
MRVYKTNPVLAELDEEVRRKPIFNKSQDLALVHRDTGLLKEVSLTTYKEVSKEKFVKVYLDGIKQFAKLNKAGCRVFEILFNAVQGQVGADSVVMSYKILSAEEVNGLSVATFDRGIRELIAKQFIVPTELTSFYWINPKYMFNGDRLRLVTEYKRSRISADEIIRAELKTISNAELVESL